MTETAKSATLTYGDKSVELPVLTGSTGPDVIDIRKLYGATGAGVAVQPASATPAKTVATGTPPRPPNSGPRKQARLQAARMALDTEEGHGQGSR